MEPTPALVSLLTSMGQIFTSVIGYFGTVFAEFMAQPILILTFGIGFAATVIHMARGFLGR